MNQFLKEISVEPSSLFFQLNHELLKFFYSNLYLQKSCRNDTSFEPNLGTKCDNDKSGVLFVTEINSKYYLVSSLVAAFLTVLVTSWSDEAGRRRRPLVYLPLIGQVLSAVSGCFHSFFWSWAPVNAAFLEVILECVTGGICLFSAATQIYVCDVSTTENRTMRIGILGTVKTISLLIGDGSAGFILRCFGFFYSFVLCLCLSLISLVFAFVFLKDISISAPKRNHISRILGLRNVVDSFRVIFSRKLGSKRIIVFFLLTATMLSFFTLFGEMSVLYLYLRYKFHWSEESYSAYLLYRFSVSAMGNFFASVVLSKCLKIHDGLIGIIAGIFDTVAIIGLLFATENWQIYLIPILDVFHSAVLSVGASFVSKFYQSNESGRLNSVIGVFIMMNCLSYPTYNTVFQNTLETFPSAFCIVSVFLDIGIVLLFWMSYILSKRFEKPSPIVKEQKPMMGLTQ